MELNQMRTNRHVNQESIEANERRSSITNSSSIQVDSSTSHQVSRSSDNYEELERKNRVKEVGLDDDDDHIPGFKITSTALIVLCLINIVIYIKLLTETLTIHDSRKKNSRIAEKYSQRDVALIFLLLGAIIVELIGLVSILCRSRVLILIYGISMIVALVCMIYLLQYKLGALVVTIANVIAIWRCYYLLNRHS